MGDTNFYLGRSIDLSGDERVSSAASPVLSYSPDDLTTHAVIVGMTGSGKTGLLVDLLEEAALQGIPAIVIDPKGDLTNLLLHFPALLPTDFEPWINPEAARRAGKTLSALSAETAAAWGKGLADWGLGREQLEKLRDAVDYVVYTPGSSVGEPVNLLASFVPPAGLNWQEHSEILRERIAATATALLGLAGTLRGDIDPLRSREHILLCNIIESAWTKGSPLDLVELILQVQNPPFERLGAFPINNFFPEKERLALAMQLNNFLAAPSFQSWIDGDPLDTEDLLITPQGKPRMSIFYLAHLDESERMFFVTLLLASVETWMRSQRGSPGLRALLAFDEITGYLPPVANPPSRTVLLRMLKQARAFGLGLLLASQNPVDLDYKSLSNAGTWFVGHLQTEQDKNRLLDGLQSIEGGMDRENYNRLIAGLRPRTFLLHNIHDAGQQVFETRWSLNYLAGPLTRAQLGGLKVLGSAPDQAEEEAISAQRSALSENRTDFSPPTPSSQPTSPEIRGAAPSSSYTRTPPAAPAGVQVLFAAPTLSVAQAFARLGGVHGTSQAVAGPVQPLGMVYQPALLFQAEARYFNRRYSLDYIVRHACLAAAGQVSGQRIDWDKAAREPLDPRGLDAQPLPESRFAPLPGWLSAGKLVSAAQKEFLDWVYRGGAIRIFANETLKVYSTPDDSHAAFRQKCDEAARTALKAESERIDTAFAVKLNALARRVDKQESIVAKYEDVLDRRRMEEVGTNFELIFSIFTRRKRSISSALSKGRMTSTARAELEAADQALDALQQEYHDLEAQKAEEIRSAQERWARAVGAIAEVPLTPLRKDIYLEIAALAWIPVYLLQAEGRTLEAPAV